MLPSGEYAVHIYRGLRNGVEANKALMAWVTAQHREIAQHESKEGDTFESRYETTLTDTRTNPDQEAWETEIAMKLQTK